MSPTAQRRVALIVPPILVGLLALPFVLRQNAWWEWTTAFWLLERQAAHVSEHGIPTLFLQTDVGRFNDFYVFYGGFTFSVLAYPAAVLGAWPVFAATSVLAAVGGYLGIAWTARNLGLSARAAILPGLIFSTTPYVVSDLYGRGAWSEFLAVNAAAVALGAFTGLVWRPEQGRVRCGAALAGAAAVLAGAHTVTTLLSAIVLPLAVLAVAPFAAAGLERGVLLRRAAGALGVLVLGAGLAGAWLVTNLWLGPHTFIATSGYNERMLKGAAALADPSTAFALWPRLSPAYQSEVYAQVPVLPLAWTVAALVAVVALRGSRRLAASAAALGALGLALILTLTHPAWWLHFPRVLQAVQLPERLIAYVAIVVALAATVALLALRTLPARRALTGALVAAVAVQCAMGAYVALHTKGTATYASAVGLRHGDVTVDREPRSFADKKLITQYQFRIADEPTGPKATRPVAADPVDPTADVATLRGTGRVGEHRVAPVAWSPLVRVDGDARYGGRTADGTIAVTVTRTDAAGRFTATVRPKCTMMCLGALRGDAPWQLLVGRLVTLLSALALLGLGVAAARGGVRWPARARPRVGGARRARRRRLPA